MSEIAKIIKTNVSAVQGHLRAVERAREIYLAAIKRAEADYFERIREAGELLVTDEQAAAQRTAETPPATGDGQEQAATT